MASAQVAVGEDVDEAVARAAENMERQSPESIWDEVRKISALGSSAIDAIEEIYDSKSPKVQLGLASALGELEEHEDAIERAFALMTKSDAEIDVRVLAGQLIDRYGPFVEDTEYLRRMGPRLEDVLDDPVGNPLPVMVVASQALYGLTGTPRGRKNLYRYLGSEDVGVRNMAALALAEIGQFSDPEVKDVLRTFQDEPGLRGRMARTYMDLDLIQRQLEQAEKRTSGGGDKWALLSEIEKVIKEHHIYGDSDMAEHDRLAARAAKGIALAMDRHSSWYTAKETKEFMEDMDREYGGIGAYVGFRGEPPIFTILRPIYSGPAYEVGLRSRDVILDIEGWPTDGQPLEDIISRLKGVPGTKVTLSVFRPGWETQRTFEVTRRKISIASCQGELLPGNIGYILVSTFSDDTAEELKRLLSAWHDAGTLNGIIIDLRSNGGGYLETARDVADQFLPKDALIVYSEGRNPEIAPRQDLFAREPESFPGIPMVVMINGSSASASEIVCGALKVHKRATVIGMRSFGKGSVQRLLQLENEPQGRLRLTIARYFLPDGTSIHKETDPDGAEIKGKEGGIDPDIVVDLDVINDIRDAEAILQLEQANKHREYTDAHIKPDSKESVDNFERLVLYGESRGDTFPGFAEFYASLSTGASEDSVKKMLRNKAREVLQDLRKAEYLPLLPIDQDTQLQAALIFLYRTAKLDLASIDGMQGYSAAYDRLLADQETLRKRFSR